MHGWNGQNSRWMKAIWGILSLAFLIGIVTCLIVNVATSGGINWAWIPIVAIGFAWGILTTLLLGGKKRFLYTLIAFCVLIMPLLLTIEANTPGPDWAWQLGFPLAGVTILWAAVGLALFRYTRINRWYCVGLTVLAALPINRAVEFFITKFQGGGSTGASTAINMLGTICIACVFFVIGTMTRGRRKSAA